VHEPFVVNICFENEHSTTIHRVKRNCNTLFVIATITETNLASPLCSQNVLLSYCAVWYVCFLKKRDRSFPYVQFLHLIDILYICYNQPKLERRVN